MASDRESFVAFAWATGCLRFGDFTLKSGRSAPYFFNLGEVHAGEDLFRLGAFYARAILKEVGDGFDLVFGPAYKGIPLATATAIALSAKHGLNKAVAYDRKEVKLHGEGGRFLGRQPRPGDRIVMVDDVITTGGTKDQALSGLREAADISVLALVVGLDRMERDEMGQSALVAFGQRHGVKVKALATVHDVVLFLQRQPEMRERVASMEAYLAAYGCIDPGIS